jgi:hypothetical protein
MSHNQPVFDMFGRPPSPKPLPVKLTRPTHWSGFEIGIAGEHERCVWGFGDEPSEAIEDVREHWEAWCGAAKPLRLVEDLSEATQVVPGVVSLLPCSRYVVAAVEDVGGLGLAADPFVAHYEVGYGMVLRLKSELPS